MRCIGLEKSHRLFDPLACFPLWGREEVTLIEFSVRGNNHLGTVPRSVIRMSGTGGNTKKSSGEIQKQIAALSDPVIEKRHGAVSALREIGEPAVDPLITALAGAGDNDHRWYIAIALSRIGKPAIAPLIGAMKEKSSHDFRRYAAASLGEIGLPAIDALIDGMASDDRELRGFLSQALCRIGKPAVEPLTRRLGDDNEVIQSCVTLTLWQMGETGLPAMVKKVQDED
jgi:HEAT repeat protein